MDIMVRSCHGIHMEMVGFYQNGYDYKKIDQSAMIDTETYSQKTSIGDKHEASYEATVNT